METCILVFKGSRAADDAYAEVLERQGTDNRWLLDVATISRPLVGRVRVTATLPDGETIELHEGDVTGFAADGGVLTRAYASALAGWLGSMFAAAEEESDGRLRASDVERRLFHLDDIKKAMPRDTSALLLIANDETCDAFVRLFEAYNPKVIRVDVEPELRTRLEALERRMQQVDSNEGMPIDI